MQDYDNSSLQATEDTAAQRSSVTVVNIPIAGDDSNPVLDKQFYRASIVEVRIHDMR